MDEITALTQFLTHALTAPAQPMFPPPLPLIVSSSSSSSPTESDDEPPQLSRSPSVASMNSTAAESPSLRKQSLSLAPVVAQVVLVAAPALRPPVSKDQAAGFARAVTGQLLARMNGHWHTDNPQKGSAYRALSIINGKPDLSLLHAADTADIMNLGYYFPTNITFWIDPGCVSFRIGDSGSISNIWVDKSVVSGHTYGSIMTESSLASDSPQFTSARMALAAALPPSPPQLSRQQLRQLKIQQKQTELQEMARSLSQQYNVYNTHCPTLVNSPSCTPGTLNTSPATTSVTMSISSPPSLSSLGRQKSAPTNKQSSSSSKKYQSPKPHNDSLYNSSLSNNNAGFSQNSSYNNSNNNSSPPQSRRTKSYINSHNKKSQHNHHSNGSNNISENTNQQQQAPAHIPGLAFKDPHKMSRGGSGRSSHKSKAYYGSSSAASTAVC
ncbi:UNVERIFIED_CONTAM: Protein btg1 [Siphonaria sp. JEL0065]|nr:Protein btg1 [Siphonaria sp. JEL0065]